MLPTEPSDSAIQHLTNDLNKKIIAAQENKAPAWLSKDWMFFNSCHNTSYVVNYDDSCVSSHRKCLRHDISEDPRERLKEILTSVNSSVHNKYFKIMERMRQQVNGGKSSEIIIASALSSNHFKEANAMFKNFHETAFRVLTNFTLVVYDLGLTEIQRNQILKHGRCVFVKFPFDELPDIFKNLRCFSWKVLIIAAHYEQADVLIWGDSSVRFINTTALLELIHTSKLRGIQQRNLEEMARIPSHTMPFVFERFGYSPCAFLSFRMCEGNFGVYHREALIRRAVIQPWLACAVSEDCMCPSNWQSIQKCWRAEPRPNHIGLCHRFDQSTISIILAHLFREHYHHFTVDTRNVQVTYRDEASDYFDELDKKLAG